MKSRSRQRDFLVLGRTDLRSVFKAPSISPIKLVRRIKTPPETAGLLLAIGSTVLSNLAAGCCQIGRRLLSRYEAARARFTVGRLVRHQWRREIADHLADLSVRE